MIKHHFSDHLYAKECFIPAGSILVQHKHEYDHLSILAKGRIKVDCDGVITEYEAPQCLNIIKGVNHGVLALTDCVWYCVHSTDETDPDKVDEVLIQKEGV
jgi:quercetin dioxygenase-like cupin family protein